MDKLQVVERENQRVMTTAVLAEEYETTSQIITNNFNRNKERYVEGKCGVYAYTNAPDFQILLFAYAFDDEDVKIVDLAQGEQWPDEVVVALLDSGTIKTAYNANFERVCLSKYYPLSVEEWRCSAVASAELGLPQTLAGVAQALGLEQQKDARGKALINYFCKPWAIYASIAESVVNFNHVTIDSNCGGILAFKGEVNIYGGTIEAKEQALGITANGVVNLYDGKLANSATTNAYSRFYTIDNRGTLHIKGGTVNSAQGTAINNSGNLDISGGTVQSGKGVAISTTGEVRLSQAQGEETMIKGSGDTSIEIGSDCVAEKPLVITGGTINGICGVTNFGQNEIEIAEGVALNTFIERIKLQEQGGNITGFYTYTLSGDMEITEDTTLGSIKASAGSAPPSNITFVGTVDIPSGSTLTVAEGATFTIGNETFEFTLNNQGEVINHGSIIVSKTTGNDIVTDGSTAQDMSNGGSFNDASLEGVYQAGAGTITLEKLEENKVKLIFDHAEVNGAIQLEALPNCIIELVGDNTVNGNDLESALYGNGDITVIGDGTLNCGAAAFGITTEGKLTMESGQLKGLDTAYGASIKADAVEINGGTIDLCNMGGLYPNAGGIVINDGQVLVTTIRSVGDVVVNGGTVTAGAVVDGKYVSDYGIWTDGGELIVNGGELTTQGKTAGVLLTNQPRHGKGIRLGRRMKAKTQPRNAKLVNYRLYGDYYVSYLTGRKPRVNDEGQLLNGCQEIVFAKTGAKPDHKPDHKPGISGDWFDDLFDDLFGDLFDDWFND